MEVMQLPPNWEFTGVCQKRFSWQTSAYTKLLTIKTIKASLSLKNDIIIKKKKLKIDWMNAQG